MAAMGFGEHLRRHFPDGAHADVVPQHAAAVRALPDLRVRRIAPAAAGGAWVYATHGLARAGEPGEAAAEYVLLAPSEQPLLVELLAALATVAARPEGRLGAGSICALGRPWLRGAAADHLLVLPPYPFGPGFEACEQDGRRVVVLWLVPITAAEAAHARAHGWEALEELIGAAGAELVDPARASVV